MKRNSNPTEAPSSPERSAEQTARLNRRHGIWLLCLALLVPAVNLFGLQALYQAGWREMAYGMLTEGGKNLLYVLLDVLSVIIDCAKILPLFALLGVLVVRQLCVPQERHTWRGILLAMAAFLLLPYLSSLFLAAIFDTTMRSSDFFFLTLSALLNWAIEWAIVGIAVLILHRRRDQWQACRSAMASEQILPRRDNPFLHLLWRITLGAFFVRLTLCVVTTVLDIVSIGAPQSLGEVVTLLSPYLLLLAQTAMGYLVMVFAAQDSHRVV